MDLEAGKSETYRVDQEAKDPGNRGWSSPEPEAEGQSSEISVF